MQPQNIPDLSNIALVALSQNQVAIIDACQKDKIDNAGKWVALRRNNSQYVATLAGTNGNITMSQYLYGLPPQGQVHIHLNGITLDNRRANVASIPRESIPQRVLPQPENKKCKYRGVTIIRTGKKHYQAQCGHHYIGLYPTDVLAARAYDDYVIKKYGANAETNFAR